MIPKVIHYCWFGRNPLPPMALKCIESWKKFFPDYEIKEWNEDNFDVDSILYTQQAYQAGKYAFVSDYARFWILYHHGGIYFDTDVEVIKPMDDIIREGNFMGFETDPKGNPEYSFFVNPGLGLGAEPRLDLYKELMDVYAKQIFGTDMTAIKTVVHHTTELLLLHGLKDVPGKQTIEGVTIYPSQYLAPYNVTSHRMHITSDTRSIHHYMDSWGRFEKKTPIKDFIRNFVPEPVLFWYNRVKNHKL